MNRDLERALANGGEAGKFFAITSPLQGRSSEYPSPIVFRNCTFVLAKGYKGAFSDAVPAHSLLEECNVIGPNRYPVHKKAILAPERFYRERNGSATNR